MATINNRQRGVKISKDLAGLSDRAKKSRLSFSDLIIPLGSIFALVILTVFVFFPMIKTAGESREELKEVKKDLQHLQDIENALNSMDDTELTEDVIMSKKIIPKVLQASDFLYYIDNLSQSKELSTDSITVSDENVGRRDENAVSKSMGVGSSNSYTGTYENVMDFLDQIQEYSPYLVTLTDISVSKSGEENWEVEFKLTGYYIPETEGPAVVNFYSPFTAYTGFPEVLDIFEVKVEKLNE